MDKKSPVTKPQDTAVMSRLSFTPVNSTRPNPSLSMVQLGQVWVGFLLWTLWLLDLEGTSASAQQNILKCVLAFGCGSFPFHEFHPVQQGIGPGVVELYVTTIFQQFQLVGGEQNSPCCSYCNLG